MEIQYSPLTASLLHACKSGGEKRNAEGWRGSSDTENGSRLEDGAGGGDAPAEEAMGESEQSAVEASVPTDGGTPAGDGAAENSEGGEADPTASSSEAAVGTSFDGSTGAAGRDGRNSCASWKGRK